MDNHKSCNRPSALEVLQQHKKEALLSSTEEVGLYEFWGCEGDFLHNPTNRDKPLIKLHTN
jgi:hypothetical protein